MALLGITSLTELSPDRLVRLEGGGSPLVA